MKSLWATGTSQREWAAEADEEPGLCEGEAGGEKHVGHLSLLGSGWLGGWGFESMDGLSPCGPAHSWGWRTGER